MTQEVRPKHYKGIGDLQPIHLIHALGLSFDAGSVIKYVCRHGRKPSADSVEDLKKARTYLDWMIAEAEGRPVVRPEGWIPSPPLPCACSDGPTFGTCFRVDRTHLPAGYYCRVLEAQQHS